MTAALALLAGVFAASRHNRLGDLLVMGLSQLGIAVPNFWFAIMLILVFSVGLQWLPAGGFPGWGEGLLPALQSLATLAFDCRRTELFRAELMDALRIVERGDLAPSEMRGAWAGEIGQTQFMPSSWIKFAVDFDGNGRRDLLRSATDVLASTANYLASYGWQRGKDFGPGSANFAVIQQWNKSEVYAKTIAAFAGQLARAP